MLLPLSHVFPGYYSCCVQSCEPSFLCLSISSLPPSLPPSSGFRGRTRPNLLRQETTSLTCALRVLYHMLADGEREGDYHLIEERLLRSGVGRVEGGKEEVGKNYAIWAYVPVPFTHLHSCSCPPLPLSFSPSPLSTQSHDPWSGLLHSAE